MIQNESKVKIADNTWWKIWKVFRVLNWSKWRFARMWDKVVISIKEASTTWQVSKWDVVRAVVVRARKEMKRNDGTYIRFEDNAVAIIDKEGKPKWKRIFWPVARELREKGFKEVANIAEEII
jgi:large subunit ribosomal protein L14